MISVIICSIDKEKFSRVSQNYAKLLQHEPHEIIGIHDASSLAEGYNRGVAKSIGSTLVFSHDDIEILSPDFAQKLLSGLGRYDIIGVAGTSCLTSAIWLQAGQPFIHGLVVHPDHSDGYVINVYGVEGPITENIQALDGLFFAVNRPVAEALRFDDATFGGFHCYDLDFTFAAYLSGCRLAVINEIILIHQSDGSFNQAWETYKTRFMQKYEGRFCIKPPTKERLACAPVSKKEKILGCCELPALMELTKRMRVS